MKERFRSKTFLLSLFAATLVFAKTVALAFGYDITVFNEKLTAIFTSGLAVLAILGFVVDSVDSTNKSEEGEKDEI